MPTLYLSDYEKNTLRMGCFPCHQLPSEHEEKKFSHHVISGIYWQNNQSNQMNSTSDKTEFIEELKNNENKWYFFLYGQKYHYFKIDEFVALDAYGMDGKMKVKYMLLASMSEETKKIFLLNGSRYIDRIAFSQFKFKESNYKEHLINRHGAYFISEFIHLKNSKHQTYTKENWKYEVYLNHILFKFN